MKLLIKYREVFSLRDEIGECPNLEADIKVIDESCKVLLPVSLVVHIVLCGVGEYCESVPLNRTGSYVLSASI